MNLLRFLRLMGGVALGALCTIPAQGGEAVLTDLGPGTAWDVNSAGEVAASIGGAAAWFDGKVVHSLPTLPNPDGGPPIELYSANGMNDAGQLLVNGHTMMGDVVVRMEGAQAAIVWGRVGYSPLGTGINARGTVCGYWQYDAAWPGQTIGFISGARDLDDLYSPLYALNGSDVAVGMASTNSFSGHYPTWHPARACVVSNSLTLMPFFLDSRPVPEVARTDDLDLSSALGINEQGWVVGFWRGTTPGPRQAFLRRGEVTGVEMLGTLGGAESEARDVNGQGVVVGWAHTAEGRNHAFVYSNGVMSDLNGRVPPGSGWELQQANAVNDAGQVVGFGLVAGSQHAFLLSPPGLEPAPIVTVQPVGAALVVASDFTLRVEAQGGTLSYQWQKEGVDIPGATESSLAITHATALAAGTYRVIVINTAGRRTISNEAVITVFDPRLAVALYAGITVEGEVGAKYRIDSRIDADAGDWVTLTTLQLTNRRQLYLDLDTPQHPRRIYRAVRVAD